VGWCTIVISKIEIKITKKKLPGARDESRLEPLFVVVGWLCGVTWQQGPETRLEPHSSSSGGSVDLLLLLLPPLQLLLLLLRLSLRRLLPLQVQASAMVVELGAHPLLVVGWWCGGVVVWL
jgi:hypothetical protein